MFRSPTSPARLVWLGAAVLGVAAVYGTAGAAGPYDGVYTGTQRTTLTNNQAECSKLDLAHTQVNIQDSQFTRQWSGPIHVTVAPDGTFDASSEVQGQYARGASAVRTAEIKGKITDGDLEADIGTRYCAAHLSLKKS